MNEGEIVEIANSDDIYRIRSSRTRRSCWRRFRRAGSGTLGHRRRLGATAADARRYRRERHLADDRARQAHAARRCARDSSGRSTSSSRLRGQSDQVLAEQAIDAVVEAHDVDRRDDLPVLDPERREARHPGHAAGGAVGEIQIPEIADVEAGVERRQRIVAGKRAAAPCRATPGISDALAPLVASANSFAVRGLTSEPTSLPSVDQRHRRRARKAFVLERRRDAVGGVLG